MLESFVELRALSLTYASADLVSNIKLRNQYTYLMVNDATA